ncbi:MAG: Gfo/Idh/MocA family oxidoreductase [Rhizobiales bacterium]|nr:Gfo/Idh/MocA family oxidoreductase [Hyphomicrobiales bacterium]MBO6700364.1 Gfo/Idh/MocA family oxidoreductase [Hyphomicrobiales bacterium]MBO6737472.1 Gfo/Idh/MocA family oxidoreductase [Hyphomicrobiales bacterium]MBO6913471.1 Gfo/Idh/MocA family oxidoreductase [Hyphomicrobiales bacterium]MBO6955402.1 Gfo/Idh/MocA family oxidoreductase [Hyphomicrobiales bacterium]
MVRLALVGPGRWGRILVQSVQGLSETVTFTHAVARSPSKVASWCDAQGISLNDDMSTVLADPDIDGIVLATPHSQHADQIVQVAKAGKHLFCEKPVALTRACAEVALLAVREADIVFAPGHNRRFLPAVQQMKAVIEAGQLGKILHFEGNMSSHVGFGEVYTSDMWRVAPGESPAGGLAAAGIHVIDLMIHLLGPIVSLIAQSDRLVHDIDHDDTTSMLLRFQNGATGYVATMTATASIFRLQVFGENGWLELRGDDTLTWKPVVGEPEVRTFPEVSTERLELEAFARAITNRSVYPIPLADVLNGISVFEGVSASLKDARRIRL